MAELERIRQQSRNPDQSSCRTPGMAGRKALVTFRIALPHNFRPHPQKIQLYGSWTSYTTSIPMERDVRAGHGIWKSGGPKGGLEQGAVYGYYYVMDGKNIYYDPAAGRTVRDDRTGRVVNVIEVPIEMPSEEDQRIREKASVASMLNPAESGKADGGGDIRGHEQDYEMEQQHHQFSPRRKIGESSAAARVPPPPPQHMDYMHSPERRRAAVAAANISPSSSRVVVEQPSMSSLQRYRSESSISTASISVPQEQPSKALRRTTTTTNTQYPPLNIVSPRRKPVPQANDPYSSSLPQIAPRSDGGGIRKPYTFLGKKISIPSLPSTPVEQQPPGPSQSQHFYSPYPPPPPQASASQIIAQQTPSPIYPADSVSRGRDDPPRSKKESRGKRWSFLPQPYNRPQQPPVYNDPAPSSTAAVNIPSPRRKIGRLFSMSKQYSTSAPRPDIQTRATNVTVNTGYTSTSTVHSRAHDTPSPLDIPPPPEFVLADRHRTRTRGESMEIEKDQGQQGAAKKNADSVNLGGETLGAGAQVGAGTIRERERRSLGAGSVTPGLGLGAGPRASGAENRVRGSFLPDRETRLGNLLRDEESGGRRTQRSVSLGGGRRSLGAIGDGSPLRGGIQGGGFVMVGSEMTDGVGNGGGDGDTSLGNESNGGHKARTWRTEEVVSTPGTIIRLDPDEFRPRVDGTIGNVKRSDIGNGNDIQHKSTPTAFGEGTRSRPSSSEGISLAPVTPLSTHGIIRQEVTYRSSFLLDTHINISPITIVPKRRRSSATGCGVGVGDAESYHSSNNSYLDSGIQTATSSLNTSHSCSPRSTPSTSYSPGGGLHFLKRPLSATKGGNRDIGPYAGDVILRNKPPVDDDDDGVEMVMTLDLDDSSGFGYYDGSGGGVELGHSLEGAEGDGGIYHSPRTGKVRYLKSLRCLREEVAGELESKKEMWEELGWLGSAVV